MLWSTNYSIQVQNIGGKKNRNTATKTSTIIDPVHAFTMLDSSPVAVIAMTMVGVVGGSYFIVDGATPISPLPNNQAKG